MPSERSFLRQWSQESIERKHSTNGFHQSNRLSERDYRAIQGAVCADDTGNDFQRSEWRISGDFSNGCYTTDIPCDVPLHQEYPCNPDFNCDVDSERRSK